MENRIQDALDWIETEFEVRIFVACESGSRAWGFASTDSDYDVRFLHLHPQEWYLCVDLDRKRDVIEEELARLANTNFDRRPELPPWEPPNELFRASLKDVWGYT